MERIVAILCHRAPVDAVIKKGSIDLGLRPGPVEFDVRDAAAEKVPPGRTGWVGAVRRLTEGESECGSAIRRFVETDYRRSWGCEAAAIRRGRPMARNR